MEARPLSSFSNFGKPIGWSRPRDLWPKAQLRSGLRRATSRHAGRSTLSKVGGVVDRPWLVGARVQEQEWANWTWPSFPVEVTRPMNNCLRPANIPRSAYRTSLSLPEGTHVPDSSSKRMSRNLQSMMTMTTTRLVSIVSRLKT
jgi:hypothetical protein